MTVRKRCPYCHHTTTSTTKPTTDTTTKPTTKTTTKTKETYQGTRNPQGQKHGHGKITYPNGETYDGQWKFDTKNGTGVWTLPTDGKIIRGQFKNDHVDGHAILIEPDGMSGYDGEWKNGRRHGRGVQTFYDGTTYDGEWRDDLSNGHGVLTKRRRKEVGVEDDDDGEEEVDIFDSQWKNGKMNGPNAILTFANGMKYIGEVQNDQMTGRGYMTMPNGSTYEGNFVDGKLHGWGVMETADGGLIRGQFRDGTANGSGVMILSNGDMYRTMFENGVPVGRGVIMRVDGSQDFGVMEQGRFLFDDAEGT